MYKYIIAYFIFILNSILLSQQIRFERITTQEGLSQNSITCICQDSTGFVWFGTYNGLNRYDGYDFKVFKYEQNNSTSLGDDHIAALCVDNSGVLWIGTNRSGLNKYDSKKECFIRYQHDPNDPSSISNNSITSLLLDNKGNLWIGTFKGINKLVLSQFSSGNHKPQNKKSDKLKFIRYNHNDFQINNENWDYINCIYEDKSGLIWIGTRYGLTRFDPTKNNFANYLHQPGNSSSLSSNIANKICEDKFGNLWVGTWDAGLNRFDREKEIFIHYSLDKNDIITAGKEIITSLYKDKSNDLWVGSRGNGLGKLISSTDILKKDETKKRSYDFVIYKNSPFKSYSISSSNVQSIFEDRSGLLWIGTQWGGLNKFDKKKSNIVWYSYSIDDPNGLNQSTIFTILKDHNDVLWLGTFGGINLFDLKAKKFSYLKNIPNDLTSLMNNTISTIYEDKNHTIWIGMPNGLNEFVPSERKFIPYIIQTNEPSTTNIFTICKDRFDYLWLGTYGNGVYRLDRKTRKIINYLHNTADSTSIGDNIIWTIYEDRFGDLWFGTDNGGLNRLDRKNNRFIRYTHNNNLNSITSNKIFVIFEDKSGGLWLGTTLGLNKLIWANDKKTNPIFIRFTKEDGLISNMIYGILEDAHGNLWLSTDKGISRFNPVTKKTKNFGESDGFQDNEFSINSCFKNEKTGEMYFGGINGFNIFHPDSIKDNLMPIKVVFTDLKIFNKSIQIDKEIDGQIILEKSIIDTKEIKLNYSDNIFTIEYAALNFTSYKQNLYAYKLEGFEKEWNFVDANQRTVTYTNLDPGKYIFKVKASNNDGIWNEQAAILNIIITPPFWKTWWFRSLIILLLGVLLITIYKLRTRRIRRINRELEEHVAKRTEELEMTNKELEAFTYSVSHDLRTPLRGMSGFSKIMIEDYAEKLDEKGKDYLDRINAASKQMGSLIDDMLKLSRLTRSKMIVENVNLSSLAESITADLIQKESERKVIFNIAESLFVKGDVALLKIMLQNLFGNAWKFTSRKPETFIEFGKTIYNDQQVFFIKDNGIGFRNEHASKIFEAFQRLQNDFEGTGIGLATVQRIVIRHGGKIWAEGKINEGATFYFTLER